MGVKVKALRGISISLDFLTTTGVYLIFFTHSQSSLDHFLRVHQLPKYLGQPLARLGHRYGEHM